MTNKGHCRAAFIFSIVPILICLDHGSISALLSFISCIAAASFPDWSERLFKIPHRTIFHTLSLWVALGMYSYENLSISPFWAIGLGFSCGCISHWLGDVPNKQGLPIFTPLDRFSLHLWDSGEHEQITISLIAIIALMIAAMIKPEIYQHILLFLKL